MKRPDVVVAVWLAGCEYLRQRLNTLPQSLLEKSLSDEENPANILYPKIDLLKVPYISGCTISSERKIAPTTPH